MKLPHSYYQERTAVQAASELLGMALYTRIDGVVTAGVITETEAYMGAVDKASHAFGGRRTARNEVMYGPGGMAYIYLCYGIHHLFNIVVGGPGEPQAVLIRAIHPWEGMDEMMRRRGTPKLTTGGPGTLSQALGIHTRFNGEDLTDDRIWVADVGVMVAKGDILIGPRIGVDYAGADAALPYRYRVAPSRLHQ
jgi:DNA-3-methyladenine glycosylase